MKTEKPIILKGDLVEHRTNISGYVCKKCNRFYGDDERQAGWCCATHQPCLECGELSEKHWAVCEKCRRKRRDEKFWTLEEVEWDGETPLVSYCSDRYYFDSESVEDAMWAHDPRERRTLEDLRLMLCKESKAPHFEMVEFLQDVLVEDGEPAGDYLAVEKVVNDFIQANRPYSWTESKFRVSLESLRKFVRESDEEGEQAEALPVLGSRAVPPDDAGG